MNRRTAMTTTATESGHDNDPVWLRAFRDAVISGGDTGATLTARLAADAEVAKLRRSGATPPCGCRYEAALRDLLAQLGKRERSLLLGSDPAIGDAYRAARELVTA
jgi:hypothetical protein